MKIKRVITLGFFDGVHIGHQALLSRCREIAGKDNLRSTALTFDHHPDGLVLNKNIKTLTTNEQRAEMLKRFGGVSDVLLLPFDETVRRICWQDFFQSFLLDRYSACHLIAGENFRFGYKGKGSSADLKKKCTELSIGCDIIEDIKLDGQTVSSTKIKELIAKGDMEEANRFLGHPHEIAGNVLFGRGIGSRELVPTINMASDPSILLPPYGVYIAKIHLDEKVYPAVTNIGVRPTFGDNGGITIETNAIGYRGNAYGKQARLEVLHFLRPERQYQNADMLLVQIKKDLHASEEYFSADR